MRAADHALTIEGLLRDSPGLASHEIDAMKAAVLALRSGGETAEEPESRRWYAACWRDDNGTLNALDSSTVAREYAEADVRRWRGAEEGEPNGQPGRVVLGTKIEHPWVPVEQEGAE
jgi:hypothetical protein